MSIFYVKFIKISVIINIEISFHGVVVTKVMHVRAEVDVMVFQTNGTMRDK